MSGYTQESDKEYAEVDVEVIYAGDKAVRCTDGEHIDWIPYSVISEDNLCRRDAQEANEGDALELLVELWFLEQKGWV